MRIRSVSLPALFAASAAQLFAASAVHAGPVVNHADVNGLRTFQDLGTGLIWVDLDNFFNQSTSQMRASVELAGFTFAESSRVEELLSSLPLDGNGVLWGTYAPVMGRTPNREWILGTYEDGGDPNLVGQAFAGPQQIRWLIQDGRIGINDIPSQGTPIADVNLWAYRVQPAADIPEPGTLALLGAGVLSGGMLLRRRRRA